MSSNNQNAISEFNYEDESLNIYDLEFDLERSLQIQLSELYISEEEMKKIGDPENLSKVISDEIWNQFANQIGLDITSETLIQKYDREHLGEEYEDISKTIMQDEKYIKANAEMKEKYNNGELKDEYTGKIMNAYDKPNLDHVVSRKELYDNNRRKQANIDTKDLANKEENLASTNESLNKSKNKKSINQYISERKIREESLKKQNVSNHKKIDESNKSDLDKRIEHENADKRLNDKLAADDKLMLEADKRAREAINKDIAIGVAKQTAKKAGKDALKAMAIAALFDLLKSIMNGLIRFFKEKNKSFQLFLDEMKQSIKNFISHISSFVKTGASSLIGTVISEIFGPISAVFNKLVSFIKQGVKSIMDAFQYLTNKENKYKPLSIKIAQVGKIVTAGLAAAGAIVGGEIIEKALLQIPVMHVQIPLLGSIANITGIFLSSLISGIIGAIVINCIDLYIVNYQRNENLNNQIDIKNNILNTQNNILDIKSIKMQNVKECCCDSIKENHKQTKKIINESIITIFDENKIESIDKNEHLYFIEGNLSELLDEKGE